MGQKIVEGLRNTFIALEHKNFRYYWIGMCVSLIGTWMQNIAQPWLAYSLTDSPFLLSLVGTLQFLPMLLFSLFAGVFIDRFSKKKLLIFTQTASLVITLVLAILILLGHIQYWHILVMSALLGIVNTLDMPARQSFVIELVGKEHLMNAIALNSSVFNIARVIGPALAGIVMGYLGIATCFFINAISFGAVIVSLFMIQPLPIQKAAKISENIFVNILDGLKYIKARKILLNGIIGVLIVGTFAMNFNVLVPIFAKEVLKQEETGFGFLMSFMGVGSFLGALYVAMKSKHGPLSVVLRYFPVLIGGLLLITGFANNFYWMGLGLAATGFCFVAFSSTANSLIQFNTDDAYRGRVMSVYTLVFGGSTPIGNLFAGIISDHYGAKAGFIACGFMILVLILLLIALRGNLSQKLKSH